MKQEGIVLERPSLQVSLSDNKCDVCVMFQLSFVIIKKLYHCYITLFIIFLSPKEYLNLYMY